MQQNNCRDVFTLDLVDNIDAPPIDFYASIQARLKRVGEEASTYAQSLWGKSVSNFLDSTPGTEEMDDSWQPVRMLGKGSFGIVGLWQKIGRKGEIEDDVAIKEMEHPRHDDLCLQRDRRLPKEAVIMQQLNDAERRQDWSTNYILRLRSFRNFPAAGRWRFYLENGQYGDLYKLLHSYRAWDSYFPEEFLWHVFNDLAKAAVVMHEGPFTHLESGKPSDWSITHFDIKPENIYLGKRDKDATFANYPTMKLADFGLAEMTGEDDRNNPYEYRPKGTDDFKPPEQTCFTASWQRRPDGLVHDLTKKTAVDCKRRESGRRKPGYKFLSTHNIWGLGKTMHDMLTLSWPWHLEEQMNASTSEARYYGEYNENAIPRIRTTKKPDYSLALRELIRECLHIEIGKRPTPQQLLTRTQEGLRQAVAPGAQNEGSQNGPRLYYMGHEINHMPRGDAGVPMKQDDWRALTEVFWPDPVWQPLCAARWAPEVRNRDFINQPVEEGGPKRIRPPLVATAVGVSPLGNFLVGTVKWKHYGSTFPGDQAEDPAATQEQAAREEAEYQREIGNRIRNSGTKDTQVITPPRGSQKSLGRGTGSFEASRERHRLAGEQEHGLEQQRAAQQQRMAEQQRAFERLAAMAGDMPQAPVVAPRPVRVKLNPPKPPPPPPPAGLQPPRQQPNPTRKRRRDENLAIDANFPTVDGRNVAGHNLRKRRKQ